MKILVLADLHCGSVLGLMSPRTRLRRLDDCGAEIDFHPVLSKTQEMLWALYRQVVARSSGGVVFIHCGDLTGGVYDGVPGTTPDDQPLMAAYALAPLFRRVVRAVFVSGTEVHVGQCASREVQAVELLRKSGVPVDLFHHARIEVDGLVLDVAHHGPKPPGRTWLVGAPAYYLRDRVFQDREAGVEPADVYIRGHYHSYHIAYYQDGNRLRRLIILPPFSGIGMYARKRSQSVPYLTVGGVFLHLDNGNLEPEPLLHRIHLAQAVRV